jgi:ABC-type Fe3+ transport system permease subunit
MQPRRTWTVPLAPTAGKQIQLAAVAARAAALAAMLSLVLAAAVKRQPEENHPRPSWRRWVEMELLQPAASGGVMLLAPAWIAAVGDTGHAWSELAAGGSAG